MRFLMLGPLRVWDGTAWAQVRASQQRIVLAVLLTEAGRVVSTDRMIDEIWGDRPPRAALKTVQAYVMRLRRLIGDGGGDLLVTRGHGYELVLGDNDLDAAVFERLVASARPELAGARRQAAVAQLTEALALWRGPALADVPASPALAARATRLEQIRLAAVEDRLAALLDLGQHAAALDELHLLVDEHPLRERLWAQFMIALYRCGRRAEALETYHRARRILRAELGLEPDAQLRELQRSILADAPDIAAPPPAGPRVADAVPATRAAPIAPAQLPPDVAGFTGRGGHLRALDAQLPDDAPGASAVVIAAIDGAAGVGKTALAVHWAHRVRDRFPDGQLFVNLRGHAAGAPVRPIEALAQILHALGVPAEQVPIDTAAAAALYRSRLAGLRMLLLLDNANHPDQIRPLLPGSPGCLVLVTSRDRLDGLVARDGATRLAMDVLTTAESRVLLGRLLGAGRVRAEAPAVAQLARLCENLPLALRIAAANLIANPQRSIADYAARLATGDRLAALQVEGDPQATVRAAFDLSYAALPADSRRLFRLLGLAPGPEITPPAAAALVDLPAAYTARLLHRLAGSHLIDEHVPGRYVFHDLLRLYAAEQAATQDSPADRRAALARLLDSYLCRVDAAARLLYPQIIRLPLPGDAAGQPSTGDLDSDTRALEWLDGERANLVAAVRAGVERGLPSTAWRLADALRGYYVLRRYTVDWLAVTQAALAAAEADPDPCAAATAHLSLASLHWTQGENEGAIDHYTSALRAARLAGWDEGESAVLGNLGNVHWAVGNFEEAGEHYAQALVSGERTGNHAVQATALGNLGTVYWGLGRIQVATERHTQALALHRKGGARSGEARALASLAEAYHGLGQLDDALTTAAESLALSREIGDRNVGATAYYVLALVHRDMGHPAEAMAAADAAVELARDTGDRRLVASMISVTASLQHRLGQLARAAGGHRRAADLAGELGDTYTWVQALIGLAAAERDIGELAEARGHGEEALATAGTSRYGMLEGNALALLASIDLARGDLDEAVDHAEQALAIQDGTGHRLGQARAHLLLEAVLRRAGRDADALAHGAQARALLDRVGADPAGLAA